MRPATDGPATTNGEGWDYYRDRTKELGMQVVRTRCDRCQKLIAGSTTRFVRGVEEEGSSEGVTLVSEDPPMRLDLCPGCLDALAAWVKGSAKRRTGREPIALATDRGREVLGVEG